MALPFRFFRSELNGFYLYNAVIAPNHVLASEIEEFAYQAVCAWPTVVAEGQVHMRNEDVYNLGRYIAAYTGSVPGIFGPYNTVRFTEEFRSSELKLRTERGLWDTALAQFEFQNVEEDAPVTPIEDLATDVLRMTVIPEDAPVIGYIPASAIAYDPTGQIIVSAIEATPPVDEPYVAYYGEKYLVLAEIGVPDPVNMLIDPFVQYVEVLQQIRRNGPSIGLMCDLTQALVSDIVYDLDIQYEAGYIVVTYGTYGIQGAEALLRFNLWKLVVRNRFHNILLL